MSEEAEIILNTVEMPETVAEEIDTTIVDDVEEIDTTIVDDVNIDDDDEKNIEYNRLRIEPDGYLGTPIFTKTENRILKNALFIDPITIENYQKMMKDSFDNIDTIMKNEDGIFDSTDHESAKNSKNLYISTRNILVQIQMALDEYIDMIDKNKDEILKSIKDLMDLAIDKYAEDNFNNLSIKYNKDEPFIDYIIAIALKRASNDISNDHIAKLLISKSDVEFENEIHKMLLRTEFMISNSDKTTDDKNIGKDEKEILKIATIISNRFKNIIIEHFDDVAPLIEKPKDLAVKYIFNMINISSRKILTNIRKERDKYRAKCKKFRSKYICKGIEVPKDITVPLDHSFIKTRLSANLIGVMINRWFVKSLFGDETIIDDKVKFMSIINDMNSNFSSNEVITSIVSSLSFKFVFDEFEKIIGYVKYVSEDNTINITFIKNYLTYITFFNLYSEDLDKKSNYEISKIYTGFIRELINFISVKVSINHDEIIQKNIAEEISVL